MSWSFLLEEFCYELDIVSSGVCNAEVRSVCSSISPAWNGATIQAPEVDIVRQPAPAGTKQGQSLSIPFENGRQIKSDLSI